MGGASICGLTILVLLVFTAFNADFVGYHYKALKASYRRMQYHQKNKAA